MLGPLWHGAAALGYGVLSALVPIFNSEAYAGVAAAAGSWVTAAAVLVGLAAGQTIGKLVIYTGASHGSRWWSTMFGRTAKEEKETSAGRRWWDRSVVELARPRTAVPVLLAAASVGLPPLALVALASGVARTNRALFVSLVLGGRIVRFMVVVLGIGVWFH